jgi:hypothetical protein
VFCRAGGAGASSHPSVLPGQERGVNPERGNGDPAAAHQPPKLRPDRSSLGPEYISLCVRAARIKQSLNCTRFNK